MLSDSMATITKELQALARHLLGRTDVVVELHATWPLCSRGLAHCFEVPPRLEVWDGWPPVTARLIVAHEAAHLDGTIPNLTHDRFFRAKFHRYAQQAQIPAWLVWLYDVATWLMDRVPWRLRGWMYR
mgnify:CR=1 FL=1